MRSWHGPLDALLRLERQTTDEAPAAIPAPRAAGDHQPSGAVPQAEAALSDPRARRGADLPAQRTRRESLTG
jgi:hypothetical protein